MGASIGVDNAVEKYGDMTIISDLPAFIKNSELFTLLGPSGYGETTLLRTIAGFNSVEGGTIQFDDKVISDIPVRKRDIGTVFQSHVIFPHLTVRQNMEYGLKIRKVPKNQMKERADEIPRIVKIDECQDRLSERLSGGQQQRVALARAIVIHPQVLLMDEPLSNLDAKLRIGMCSVICGVQNQVGVTAVYVTHDQEEALAVPDRIAVMELGVIQQIRSSRDIYARSYNTFVSTSINHSDPFFGTVKKQGGIPSVVFANGCHMEMPNLVDTVTKEQKVVTSACPEEFSLNPEGMECEIISRTSLGKYTNYSLYFGEGMVLEDQPSIEYSQDSGHVDRIPKMGEKIHLRPNPDKISVFIQGMGQSLTKDMGGYDE